MHLNVMCIYFRTSYSSVLTIVAFTMERYIAICHPLLTVNFSGLRRAVKITAAIWSISFISAFPFSVYTTVEYKDFPPGSGNLVMESAFCAMLESNRPEAWPLLQISSFVFFLIPMFVMVFLYTRMGVKLRTTGKISRELQFANPLINAKSTAAKKNIIRMLGKYTFLGC